ncbi:prepilin peptidase [Chloroflexota bacterium]
MEAVYIIVATLLGLAIGSFLNVCIDRLPQGGSLISPRSHCDACGKWLSAGENIPVLSYLWLRGRCRHCRATIPQRVVWVELVSGIAFALLYWHYGFSAELAVMAFYFCLFLVIMVIDLEHKLILNRVVYPAAVIALVFSIFVPDLDIAPGIVINTSAPQIDFLPGFISALVGGTTGLLVFLLIVVASRGGMGWGDVKMAALIGLVLGFPLVFVAIFLAVVSGGVVATMFLIIKAKGRKQSIPFGPFLSLGALTSLLWGAEILDWYLGFF